MFSHATTKSFFAHRVCDYAAATDVYDQSDATWDDLAPKLRENVHLLLDRPCVDFGNAIFEGMPESVRADVSVEINSAEWGRQVCRAYFDDQYFAEDGTIPDEERGRFVGDHVSLFTPFVVAALMTTYQKGVGLSREEFRHVVKDAVDRGVESGVITVSPAPPFLVPNQNGLKLVLRQAYQDYVNGK